MPATQEQLDQYCTCVLEPLAESLMLHSKELGASPSAFYQTCMHRAIHVLKHIPQQEKYKELLVAIDVLEHVAQQIAEEELEEQS